LYQLPVKIHGSGAGFFFLLPVFPIKPLDATRGIDQLLFAGEKRVAVRTDFDVNLFFGRTRRPCVAACANHMTLDIFGMNAFFHFLVSFFPQKFLTPSRFAVFILGPAKVAGKQRTSKGTGSQSGCQATPDKRFKLTPL
jgi:hypothetical protein